MPPSTATVVPVTSGTRTLKDATTEAIRDWVATVNTSHYVIGSVVGPSPYPRLVRDFQSVIGRETRTQVRERIGRLPVVSHAQPRRVIGILTRSDLVAAHVRRLDEHHTRAATIEPRTVAVGAKRRQHAQRARR